MGRQRRKFFDPKYYPIERRRPQIFCCILFWSFLAYRFISQFVVAGTQVVGGSMCPTLYKGQRSVINRMTYRFRDPKRGEIVAIQRPGDNEILVKRIVALPGERVRIWNGEVYVNGEKLHEPYLPPRMLTPCGLLGTNIHVVPRDSYFVMGDNRTQSDDSRYFGCVCRDWVVGRIAATP